MALWGREGMKQAPFSEGRLGHGVVGEGGNETGPVSEGHLGFPFVLVA